MQDGSTALTHAGLNLFERQCDLTEKGFGKEQANKAIWMLLNRGATYNPVSH